MTAQELIWALGIEVDLEELMMEYDKGQEWAFATSMNEGGDFLNYWFVWESELVEDTTIEITEIEKC